MRFRLPSPALVIFTVERHPLCARLPASVLRLVVSAANVLAAGRVVMAIPAEVGIPSELLPESRHRQIKLEDVLAFKIVANGGPKDGAESPT